MLTDESNSLGGSSSVASFNFADVSFAHTKQFTQSGLCLIMLFAQFKDALSEKFLRKHDNTP